MKKAYLLAACAVATLGAGSANALTLVSAAVSGVGGPVFTRWSTGNAPSNYGLFVATPTQSDYLNPNDEAISAPVATTGTTRFFVSGDGYPLAPSTQNSDPAYRLDLTFDGGQTLTGLYTVAGNSFVGGSSFTTGGSTFSLLEFSYNRFLGDTVSKFTAVTGDDGNDYNGNFRIGSIAAPGGVPEPASWALMLGGFGLAGAAMRRRRTQVRVTYA